MQSKPFFCKKKNKNTKKIIKYFAKIRFLTFHTYYNT